MMVAVGGGCLLQLAEVGELEYAAELLRYAVCCVLQWLVSSHCLVEAVEVTACGGVGIGAR